MNESSKWHYRLNVGISPSTLPFAREMKRDSLSKHPSIGGSRDDDRGAATW